MIFTITLPIKLVSEANQREPWQKKQRRVRMHRRTTALACRSGLRAALAHAPLVVTITRIAPRPLDSDNAHGAQKAVRDGVADALDIDDRHPDVEWIVRQEKGKPKEYAVRIEVSKASDVTCPHCGRAA